WADGSTPGTSSFGRARSCILLFLMGGPPQHSTWDPKPDAPAEVRGDFGPIATTVPGLSISELLPRTALVADKFCILRAVAPGDNAHSSSGYYMLTGRPHLPMNFENANPGPPNDAPSLGAVLRRVTRARGGLPPTITLPHRIFNTDGSVWPGQDAGLLGRSADPWLLNARLTPEGYRIQEIDLPANIDPGRLGRRIDLLDRIQRRLDDLAPAPPPPHRRGARRRPSPRPPPAERPPRSPGAPPAEPSGSMMSPRRAATATATPRSDRAYCWPAGWSRPVSGWCRSTGTGAPT